MGWSAQDVSAVVSAVGGMFSAAMAGLAFIYQNKSQKNMDKEKEELSKARFYQVGWSRGGNILTLRIDNKNPSPAYDIIAKFKEHDKINISIKDPGSNDNCEFIIEINLNGINETISDLLIIKYKNIYGKEFTSSKKVFIPYCTNENVNLGNKYFMND